MEEQNPINSNRRTALKALAAATGAAGLAALPSQWSKPALKVGAVPAHAQTSCIDFAVVLENFVETDGGDLVTSISQSPDAGGDNFVAWNCGGGCLWLNYANNGQSGTVSFDVILFGSIFFSVVLQAQEDWWLAVNRDTFAWDTASNGLDIDWDGIGCEDPFAD